MSEETERIAINSGVPGLDSVLNGGFVRNRIFLVEGSPGSGKTTLAMQFLMAGAKKGEPVLYITLSESTDELKSNATSHGWTVEGVDIREYIGADATLAHQDELTMFHASEVELGETLSRMLSDIEKIAPRRVVIDALSEFRLLSETTLRYRRQLLALKRFFADRDCTVLLLDDQSEKDSHVESIAHGVLTFENSLTGYGVDRRRMRVRKMRGRRFRGGLHDYVIHTGGIEVFPRLVAAEHRSEFSRVPFKSDIETLDELLGGGPQAGTSTLLIGPAGTGKTTVAMQYVVAAAKRKERAVVFMFDELRGLLIDRLRSIDIELAPLLAQEKVILRQIDPTELSPGEFAAAVRREVDEHNARIVVIDSLNGYLNSMPHEDFLAAQLHELFTYLGQRGVATMLIVGQQGIVGSSMTTPIDASYLADTVVLFRYFESEGQVRKAISVTKKRGGAHENTIRELEIDADGIRIGDALNRFRGVLSGTPVALEALSAVAKSNGHG